MNIADTKGAITATFPVSKIWLLGLDIEAVACPAIVSSGFFYFLMGIVSFLAYL